MHQQVVSVLPTGYLDPMVDQRVEMDVEWCGSMDLVPKLVSARVELVVWSCNNLDHWSLSAEFG